MLPRYIRQSLAAVLLAAYGLACTSWRVEGVPPARLLEDHHPTQVRVTRPDSSHVILHNPSLSGDSIVGSSQGAPAGIPLGDVASLATRKGDALTTAGLIGVILGGLFVIVALTYEPPLGP
mgnify:CR=1 FL=1